MADCSKILPENQLTFQLQQQHIHCPRESPSSDHIDIHHSPSNLHKETPINVWGISRKRKVKKREGLKLQNNAPDYLRAATDDDKEYNTVSNLES